MFHVSCFNVWAANKHITKISEGSCDTEDWSNDAENSAFPYDQINAAVVNIRDVFQKTTLYALHFKKIKQYLKPDFSMPKT